MACTSLHSKEASFNLWIDPALKAAFTAATSAEARRQSLELAAVVRDPNSSEPEELRWLAAFVDQDEYNYETVP